MQFQLKHLGLWVFVIALAFAFREWGVQDGSQLPKFAATFVPVMILSLGMTLLRPVVRTKEEVESALWVAATWGTAFAILLAVVNFIYPLPTNTAPLVSSDQLVASSNLVIDVSTALMITVIGFAAAITGAIIGLPFRVRIDKEAV